MDLLFIIDENKSHYVYIKDFDRLMFHKTNKKPKNKKTKNKKKTFAKVVYSVLVVKMY